ncbi:MAG: Oligopeptide transport ATP-binding protein OppF, partial [uncultured Thermomicrobiales bacterium]
RRRDAQDAPPPPDDLPGSLRLAEPPDDGGQHRLRADADPPPRGQGRAHQAGPGTASDRRSQPLLRQPLPPRVLRRPAAADRHRAGPGREPGFHRRRRARLGPRRLDPGPDRQPARRPPGSVRTHVPVHRPRPLGRQAHLQPRRGDVPRQDRGTRPQRVALRRSTPPVHQGSPLRRADPRPGDREATRADHPERRRAQPDQPAVRLPLPHPLPLRDGGLPSHRPGLRRPGQRPPCRLSPLPGVRCRGLRGPGPPGLRGDL